MYSRLFAIQTPSSYELLYVTIESGLYHTALAALALPPSVAYGVLYSFLHSKNTVIFSIVSDPFLFFI